MELLGPTRAEPEVLIEDVPLAELLRVEDLVAQEGGTPPGAETTAGVWAGPIDPVRVQVDERLRITLTCESPADGVSCSLPLTVGGEFE